MNPYTNYYLNQAGSGLSGFSGNRYQRGHGFFGKLFSSAVLPALKFLGRQALSTGVGVAEDVLEGKNFKESAKRRAIESGRATARAAVKRAKDYTQKGQGIKKRKVIRKSSKRVQHKTVFR